MDKVELNTCQVNPGDILIAKVGDPPGVSAIYPRDQPMGIVTQDVIKLRVEPTIVIPEYLVLFLNSSEGFEAIKHIIVETTRCRFGLTQLKEIKIPLPPLEEQRRIADIAMRADRLRRTRRYTQQLSDTYLQSVFLEMFGDPVSNPKGWKTGIIKDVLAFSQYGTSNKSNLVQKGYPVLGMGNLTYSGKLNLSSFSYVDLSEEDFEDLKLQPGDIIFNRTNSSDLVGKTAHWNINMNAVLASYLVKLRLKKMLLPDYFVALLNTRYFKQLFQERCKKAIGQSNISPTLLKEFPVLIPPLPLQQKFTTIVQQFQRLRTQQQETDHQTEHLFQSILHRAFRGEL